jgi:hypothetical protein
MSAVEQASKSWDWIYDIALLTDNLTFFSSNAVTLATDHSTVMNVGQVADVIYKASHLYDYFCNI